MEFKDISKELQRTYTFPGGDTLVITKPVRLHVSDSGGHRVVDAEGRAYYVAPRWLHIAWTVAPGTDPVWL